MIDREGLIYLTEEEGNHLVDFSNILEYGDRFYTCINSIWEGDNVSDNILKIVHAKSILDSSRSAILSLLEKEENPFISRYKESFDLMIENMGRVDFELKEKEEEILKTFNMRTLDDSRLSELRIGLYLIHIDRAMRILVISPIISAQKKMRDIMYNGRKILSSISWDNYTARKNTFLYLIFRELYSASHAIGSVTGHYKPMSRNVIMNTSHPTGEPRRLPAYPQEMSPQVIQDTPPEQIFSIDHDEDEISV